jgi:isopentenyl-diphosphate Delta-isomerase
MEKPPVLTGLDRETPEFVVLVDEHDVETGTAEKMAAHKAGSLHRAFSVMIWDGAGRVLLHRRAAEKYHSGGLWTNACCGHPRPGEDLATAANRRLREEMGFSCPLTRLGSLIYRAELDRGLIEHENVHIFRGVYTGPIIPDPAEVEAFDWFYPADIQRDIGRDPDMFSFWFKRYCAEGWPLNDGNA